MTKKQDAKSEDMALEVGAKQLHEGRKAMYRDGQRYHDVFKDPDTGLFQDKLLESRSCPVCQADQPQKLWLKDGGSYVKCSKCHMCYLNPVFTDQAIKDFYVGYPTTQADVVKNESEFYRRIYERGLSLISKFTSQGALLDVGCSSGFFLDVAREKGWKTNGIELNQKELAVAVSNGHPVHQKVLEDCQFLEKFQVISLWDVFEHIKNPTSFLSAIRENLAPGGVLFIQTPNFEALAPRIMHEHCKMFDGLEHVNVYSPRTIPLIAAKNGFEVVALETVISEIPIISNFLEYEDPYFGEAEHFGKILGLIDEDSLHRNLLGYKMQIILRPTPVLPPL
jgi:2-polyprenyl-3-methyl-5-hydroxy-6-metoxy-1,4-benzoquinol methylase/Zn ribbon nucleic-acid-binding protein